jgi:hypothetical protein
MERNQYIDINPHQIELELPDSIRKKLAQHARLLGLTNTQTIVHILSNYFNSSSFQDRSKLESSSALINDQSDDDLPDDEPDEILWDFLEPEHNSIRSNLPDDTDSDFLDEPDEIIADFIKPDREEKTSDG